MSSSKDSSAVQGMAILLVGHGSSSAPASAGLKNLARDLRKLYPGARVEAAFLAQGTPDVQGAIEECVAGGAQRILVYPFFLYPGVHVLHDLPREVETARHRHEGVSLVLSAPLGMAAELPRVVSAQIESSLGEAGW